MNRIDYTLYLVTDRALAQGRPVEEIVWEGVKGGVTVVQLREKGLETGPFLEQARSLKTVTESLGVPLIINDHLDIALACGAAGVHLGQGDLDCALARARAGRRLLIGVSVSSVEQALKAEAAGADYLGISPVYATATKPDAPAPTGLEGLRRIRRAVRIPLVGIGGITAANAAGVIDAGADGIAVVSAIMASPTPRMAADQLRKALFPD